MSLFTLLTNYLLLQSFSVGSEKKNICWSKKKKQSVADSDESGEKRWWSGERTTSWVMGPETKAEEEGGTETKPQSSAGADSCLLLRGFPSSARPHPSISVWRNANSRYLLSASCVCARPFLVLIIQNVSTAKRSCQWSRIKWENETVMMISDWTFFFFLPLLFQWQLNAAQHLWNSWVRAEL